LVLRTGASGACVMYVPFFFVVVPRSPIGWRGYDWEVLLFSWICD
jgi:hypothetical protein